jgi:hypothetical protein
MVTPEEQCEIQAENAKDDEQFWDAMRDINTATAEDHKRVIVSAEAKLKQHERAAAAAAEKVEVARQRLGRLARSESVVGGLGKKLDVVAAMKTEGVTRGQMRRMALLTELTEDELSEVVRSAGVAEAHDRALNREVRRLLREKKLPAP